MKINPDEFDSGFLRYGQKTHFSSTPTGLYFSLVHSTGFTGDYFYLVLSGHIRLVL